MNPKTVTPKSLNSKTQKPDTRFLPQLGAEMRNAVQRCLESADAMALPPCGRGGGYTPHMDAGRPLMGGVLFAHG